MTDPNDLPYDDDPTATDDSELGVWEAIPIDAGEPAAEPQPVVVQTATAVQERPATKAEEPEHVTLSVEQSDVGML